jgi:hypothetical protein
MIQEISYGGWKRNLLLRGATTELVITLEIGPRIIRYGFHEGANVFVEFPEQMGGSGEKEWMIRGGHRLWTAPEGDHSYDPDNGPVSWRQLGENEVEIVQPPRPSFGFQKIMRVELGADGMVRVIHRLMNIGDRSLDLSPWVLSVMAPGGMTVIPQPALDLHPTEFPPERAVKSVDFLPNRRMVFWPFTNLSDGRYAFSSHFLRMVYRPDLPATKLGLEQPAGWIAYQNGETIFAKHLPFDPAATYPDRGSNLELFTNPRIFELESLAPAQAVAPGACSEHREHWVLHPSSTADLRDEEAARHFFAALPAIRQ